MNIETLFFEMLPRNLLVRTISLFPQTHFIKVAFTTFCAGCRNSFWVFLLHLNDCVTLSSLNDYIGLDLTALILLERAIY